MNTTRSLIALACVALIYGCAATIPGELTDARLAVEHANDGPAAELAPVELHKAQTALAAAEESFSKDGASYRTRDLAYVATRKAEMADAQASIAANQASKTQSNADYVETQGDILKDKAKDLSASQTALAASERAIKATDDRLATAQTARLESDRRAEEALTALAALTAIREDERGTILTLSGGVLFRSNESVLMPGAETKLDQIADALAKDNKRNIVVEGYTDSQGTDQYNLVLSQHRADSVRNYLVHRGYPAGLILAHGIGEASPIADNATAEGRANNRRVEIVLERTDTN